MDYFLDNDLDALWSYGDIALRTWWTATTTSLAISVLQDTGSSTSLGQRDMVVLLRIMQRGSTDVKVCQNDNQYTSFECMDVTLSSGDALYRVIVVYRPNVSSLEVKISFSQ